MGKDSLLGSSNFSISIKPKDALAKANSAREKMQVRIRDVLKDPIIGHLSRLPSKTNSPPQRDKPSRTHSRVSSRSNQDLVEELASAELRSSGIVDIQTIKRTHSIKQMKQEPLEKAKAVYNPSRTTKQAMRKKVPVPKPQSKKDIGEPHRNSFKRPVYKAESMTGLKVHESPKKDACNTDRQPERKMVEGRNQPSAAYNSFDGRMQDNKLGLKKRADSV